MYKQAVDEICRNGFGRLVMICARPGDGRLTVALALADKLADCGEAVYVCSFTRTAANLRKKLSSKVTVLSALPESEAEFFEKLQNKVPTAGSFVVVDNLSALVLPELPENRSQKKTEVMGRLREIAEKLGIQIVVTDTFSHSSDPDEALPVSQMALEMCHKAYILYKDDIAAGSSIDDDALRLKLKLIH